MKAWGRLVVLVCALAALAIPALAAAQPGYYVSKPSILDVIDLRGSHGYGVHVFGVSRNQVWVVVTKGSASAAYLGRGTVSEDGIEGEFGNLGRISVRLESDSHTEMEEPEPGCKGRASVTRTGRFTGLIRFRGENGFTNVHVKSAGGFAHRRYRTVCKRPPEHRSQARKQPPTVSLSAVSRRYARAPWFSVFKQMPSKRSKFFSSLEEANYTARMIERRPNLGIYRTASATSAPETFAVTPLDTSPVTATVAPPAPFSGSATYEKNGGGGGTWSGDLAVELPGRGKLSLTDSTYHAKLCRSFACACPIGECFFVSVGVVQGRVERVRRLAARVRP
ncbi:MAG TPA: hypothetical protein VLK37_00110 [Solirubrobacterales bacterium]|nr:hypothetical protein [Solirubrobacterales bacterium]